MGGKLDFLRVSTAVASLCCVVMLGFWLRKKKVFNAEADGALQWMLINLCTPCLIVDAFLSNSGLDRLSTLFLAPFMGGATVLVGLALSFLATRVLSLSRKESGTFMACSTFYNYAYIPIPLVMMFFDSHVMQMLFLFNVGMDTSLWSLGVMLLSGKGSLKGALSHVINAPFLAIVISIIVGSQCSVNPLPVAASRLVHMIGQATVPVALLVFGSIMRRHFSILFSPHQTCAVSVAVILRMICIPICIVLLSMLPVSYELRTVLRIQAAMPSAVLPVVLASQYGADVRLALRIIAATSMLSLLSIPFWFSVLF